MAGPPAIIRLTHEERETLERWVRAEPAGMRLRERAQIVLLSGQGYSNLQIAERLQTRPARVSKWRQRFAQLRLMGLSDAPRPGAPPTYGAEDEQRLLALLKEPPPGAHEQWDGSLLAKAAGGISEAMVWRMLRRNGIQLARQHSWTIAVRPELSRKTLEAAGLYLSPPDYALVLVECAGAVAGTDASVIRVTQRKSVRRLRDTNGGASLLVSLQAATAGVAAGQSQLRCRRELVQFIEELARLRAGCTLHVLLSGGDAPQPEVDRWMRRHPGLIWHIAAGHASWLNQVECWLGILGDGDAGSRMATARALREAIAAFGSVHHATAPPFEWSCVAAPGKRAAGRASAADADALVPSIMESGHAEDLAR